MDNRAIGFFDSGVGGLSILAEVHRLLPAENLVYVADSAHFPYGALASERLCALTAGLTRFLLGLDVKLVVVACNTATVHALAHLRRSFPDTEFIGVVPVIKTLAERSRTGTLGLLSTPNTARSAYLSELVEQFAGDKRMINVPCAGLADIVESGDLADPRLDPLLLDCLKPILAGGADVVGLGCTHYPFLRPEIERILAGRARVYDSSTPVAHRVRAVLEHAGTLAQHGNARHRVFTTGDLAGFTRTVAALLAPHAALLARAAFAVCPPPFDCHVQPGVVA